MPETKTDPEYDQLKQEIAKLRGDLSSLVDALKDIGVEKIAKARSRFVDETVNREDLKQVYDDAKARSAQVASELESQIARRPLTSVLIALGIGFVLGKLMQDGGDN